MRSAVIIVTVCIVIVLNQWVLIILKKVHRFYFQLQDTKFCTGCLGHQLVQSEAMSIIPIY